MPRRMMPDTTASPSWPGTPCRFGPFSPLASSPWQVEQFAENKALPASGSSGPSLTGGPGGGAWAWTGDAEEKIPIKAAQPSAAHCTRRSLAEFIPPPITVNAGSYNICRENGAAEMRPENADGIRFLPAERGFREALETGATGAGERRH